MTEPLRLSGEQEEFRRATHRFVATTIAPRAAAIDEVGEVPLDVLRAMADLGLFGLPFPGRYGGLDADPVTFGLCVEELAAASASTAATLVAAVCLGAAPLLRFGSAGQKERWLGGLARGEYLASLAFVETTDGGTLGGTRAVLEGGEWVIDGGKAWVVNAGLALSGLHIVTAATGDREVSSLLVPAGAPGLAIGPRLRTRGWRGTDVHDVVFGGCRVPAVSILGQPGEGDGLVAAALDDVRLGLAALGCGIARRCLGEGAVRRARAAYVDAARSSFQGRPNAERLRNAESLARELAIDCAASGRASDTSVSEGGAVDADTLVDVLTALDGLKTQTPNADADG